MTSFMRGFMRVLPSFSMIIGGMVMGAGAVNHDWNGILSGAFCAGVWAYISVMVRQ